MSTYNICFFVENCNGKRIYKRMQRVKAQVGLHFCSLISLSYFLIDSTALLQDSNGPDQTVQMCSLIKAYAVHDSRKAHFHMIVPDLILQSVRYFID